MSNAKATDVRQTTNEELVAAGRRCREELFQLRFQQHTAQLTNTSKLREVRRELARVLTVMQERDIKEGSEVTPIELGAMTESTADELQDDE